MGLAAFDTLSVANKLKEEYGVPEKQAQGIAHVMNENFVGNLATHEDLRQVREDLIGEIGRIEDKLTGEIVQLEERVIMKMTIRLGGLILATFTFFEVLNRVFPVVSP